MDAGIDVAHHADQFRVAGQGRDAGVEAFVECQQFLHRTVFLSCDRAVEIGLQLRHSRRIGAFGGECRDVALQAQPGFVEREHLGGLETAREESATAIADQEPLRGETVHRLTQRGAADIEHPRQRNFTQPCAGSQGIGHRHPSECFVGALGQTLR